MDGLGALNGRLDFIEWFYLAASRPFEALRRACAAPDASRDDDRRGWEKATRGLEVLGQCSLGLLAKALHDYLLELTQSMGGPGTKKKRDRGFSTFLSFLRKIRPSAGHTRQCLMTRSNK